MGGGGPETTRELKVGRIGTSGQGKKANGEEPSEQHGEKGQEKAGLGSIISI